MRAVIQATLGGLGVSVVPENLIQTELKSGRLKIIAVEGGRELINNIVLARRLQRTISAREKAFVDYYKKYVGIGSKI